MTNTTLPVPIDNENVLFHFNDYVCKKVKKALETDNRVFFEHATGLGKTYITLQLLLEFALQHEKEKQNKPFTVEKPKKLSVLYTAPTTVIEEYFVETIETQKARRERIGKLLGENVNIHTSLYAGLRSEGRTTGKYDIIFIDETHRLGKNAKVWRQKMIEIIENNPQATVIGMTATPQRSDDPESEYLTEIFGTNKPVSKINLEQALTLGLLPCPKYIMAKIKSIGKNDDVFAVDEQKLQEELHSNKLSDDEKQEVKKLLKDIKKAKQEIAKTDDLADAIAKVFKEYAEQGTDLTKGKFIVFCPAGNVEDEDSEEDMHKMQQIMDECDKWFKGTGAKKITKYHLYSGESKEHNARELKAFKSDENNDGIKMIFAVNMLNEGIHMGNIDGSFMLRETFSPIIFNQQLGRVLSVGNNSSNQPLIFDLVYNIGQNSKFVTEFASSVNNSIQEHQYKNVNLNLFSLDISENLQFLQNLQDRIYGHFHSRNFTWDDFLLRLQRYVDAGIPISSIKQTNMDRFDPAYPIGQKINNIRTNTIKTPDDIKIKLDELGFVWSERNKETRFTWDDFLFRLQRYVDAGIPVGSIKQTDMDRFDPAYPIGQKIKSIRYGSTPIPNPEIYELLKVYGINLTKAKLGYKQQEDE